MSSPSGGQSLFSGLFARGEAASATTDRALLQAMLDFELALIRALVTIGLAPAQAAEELAGVCHADQYDLTELGVGAGEQGTPVPALLSALRARLPAEARAHLHRGATSQDVLDTALMLVAHRALGPLIADLDAAAGACARLVREHRGTLMAGRTLLQQALPLTFAVKTAGWLVALERARAELAAVRERELAIQFGGAVGTLAPLGDRGLEVASALADGLGLAAAPLPWHTDRTRPARLACALGQALGAMAKIARDVTLLAQTEVGEATEGGGPGRGGSSTMPHKRNPVGAVAVLACAGQGPGLVASVLAAMTQEHERAAGAWQAEWEPLRSLLRLTGSAAAALAECLAGLRVDGERMGANLGLTGELLMSESVVSALTPALGRADAQRAVSDATTAAREQGVSLREALLDQPGIAAALGPDGVARALDPAGYLGVADALVDRALALRAGPGPAPRAPGGR